MSLEHSQSLTTGHIPEPRGVVPRGRHHLLPVGAEDGVQNPICMPLEHGQGLATGHIPESRRAVF